MKNADQSVVSQTKESAKWCIMPEGEYSGPAMVKKDWRKFLPPSKPEFVQRNDEYHGTLISNKDGRLIVSPNGKRYAWQEKGPGGFSDKFWRKSLSALAPSLPKGISRSALKGYPDNAQDYPRPWAHEMELGSARFKSLNHSRDDYGAVIAAHGSVRIVVSPCGGQYWLQISSRLAGWQVRRCADNCADLALAVVGAKDGWPAISGLAVRSEVLLAAIANLPHKPKDALPGGFGANSPAP